MLLIAAHAWKLPKLRHARGLRQCTTVPARGLLDMPAYQMKQDGAPGKGKGPNPYEIRWRQGPTAAESPPWYSTVGLGKRRTEMGYAQMPETVSQRGQRRAAVGQRRVRRVWCV